ncbi:MAG: putative membrane protein [Planctomycetota bacterium]|jgi:uncharacterized membrane protein
MIRSIGRILLTGFLTLVPVILTIYLLFWMVTTSERVMGSALQWALPDAFYFPGLGSIAGLVLVFLVGLLMKALFIQQLFAFGEQMLYRLPLIKSIYSVIRDFVDFFSPKNKGLGRVVTVKFNQMEVIGFVTQEDQSKLPDAYRNRDSLLVYIPMSYMIGGFTLLVPSKDVTPSTMSMDEAMRFALTAGITGNKK